MVDAFGFLLYDGIVLLQMGRMTVFGEKSVIQNKDYQDLLAQNKVLQSRLTALQEENDRLKRQLGIDTTPTKPEKEPSVPPVSLRSTPQEKIRLLGLLP